jgi:carbon-monoxide dehydrogenase small subunit
MSNGNIDEPMVKINCVVNRAKVCADVSARKSLVDWVRNDLGLTGSHVGCEHGICGACGIVVDGRVVRGCLTFAAEVDASEIETIEGASRSGRIAILQQAFFERGALQCGFCTPAMILQAAELLSQVASPTRAEIRTALCGNICRCTGYEAIIDAVGTAAARLLAE